MYATCNIKVEVIIVLEGITTLTVGLQSKSGLCDPFPQCDKLDLHEYLKIYGFFQVPILIFPVLSKTLPVYSYIQQNSINNSDI